MVQRKIKPRFRQHGRSFASDRALVEMAQTMDLRAIAKKTKRSPESVLRTARRLSISIKVHAPKAPR
jgi:hypothetical protein